VVLVLSEMMQAMIPKRGANTSEKKIKARNRSGYRKYNCSFKLNRMHPKINELVAAIMNRFAFFLPLSTLPSPEDDLKVISLAKF
jgi:hypothetical protein